jgi:hypothetical protein
MIKELRIDNLILYGAHGPVKVIEVKKTGKVRVEFLSEKSIEHGYKKMTMDVSQLDPIPLTPEWLKRMGFKKKLQGWSLSMGFQLYDYKGDLVFKVLDQVVNYTPIIYVHQLQNLYFATCLHELPIKEKV